MTILDGKYCSAHLKEELRQLIETNRQQGIRPPCLGIIQVGELNASTTYVDNKRHACEQVGMEVRCLRLPATISQAGLIRHLQDWNEDTLIDGYIVQLPLPEHINEQDILSAIAPEKDVDGFSPTNMGKLLMGWKGLPPAMPRGIYSLLQEYDIPLRGKDVVIIGDNHLLVRPLANLLSEKGVDCTITICHPHTRDTKEHCLHADMIISAMDTPCSLTADMVREGAIVVDAGNTYLPADNALGHKAVGDVDFQAVAPKCSFITPVPGGVGPMIIVSLLQNTYQAAQNRM